MKKALFAAAVVFVASASVAQAQAVKPFTFGVSAGAAIPMGDMADAAKTGLDLTGMTEYRAPSLPVTLRGELTYNRFGWKDLPTDIDGHHSILGGVVSAIAPFAATPSLKPYVIGGLGVYNVKSSMTDGDVDVSFSKTAIGLNGGLGFNFHMAGMGTFVEARYQHIMSKDDDKGFVNATGIPVTIGFRF